MAAHACRQRADDVIGLVGGAAELGNAVVAAQLAATRELLLQLRRCRVAVGLVGRVDLVAEGTGQAFIEGHGNHRRARFLEQVTKEACKAVERIDRHVVHVGHLEAYRVVGPEHKEARVNQV